MIFTEISEVPRGRYHCLLADPPWTHRFRSAKGANRAPSRHYAVMSTPDIRALPIGDLAARDCWLMLWSTWPHLVEALSVMDAWGFRYSSCLLTWVKLNPKAATQAFMTTADFHRGTGYTSRKNSEVCLLGRRGRPTITRRVDELMIAARRQHSRKPDLQYDRIEAFCPGPRLELFARQDRPHWDSFGNEVTRFNYPQEKSA